MKKQNQKLYFLLGGTGHETHTTDCCCGIPTDLPHRAYGASIYELDIPGLQTLYAMITGLDVVSFPEWCNQQKSQSTSYGTSEEVAIDEAIIQARKQGMILINYPQNQENQGTTDRAPLPYMHVCFLQLPEVNLRHKIKPATQSCTHENCTIALYEAKATEYTLQAGSVIDVDEDIEADPLEQVEVSCPDCPFSATYPNWRQAPEPIFLYIQRIHQQEYGMPTEKPEQYKITDHREVNETPTDNGQQR